MHNTFSPPDTNCKDCIFGNRKRCCIGKDLHYQNLGVELEQVDEWTTVLKNFVCPYFRDKTWEEKQKEGLDQIQQLFMGIDEYIPIVEKENTIPYFVVYFIRNIEELLPAIESIEAFTVQPQETYFVVDNNVEEKEVFLMSMYLKNTYKTPWHLNHQVDNNAWHHIYKLYNRSDFMLLMCDNAKLPNNWPDIITDKVQNQLVKFIYAANEDESAILTHPYVYNNLYFTHGPDWIQGLATTPCHLKLSL